MSEREYTRDEKSLVLYLETCLVDSWGRVAGAHLNAEDIVIAENLTKEGLLQFGRLKFRAISKLNKDHPTLSRQYHYWVRFTDKAWGCAGKWRRERSERILAKHAKELDKERVVVESP